MPSNFPRPFRSSTLICKWDRRSQTRLVLVVVTKIKKTKTIRKNARLTKEKIVVEASALSEPSALTFDHLANQQKFTIYNLIAKLSTTMRRICSCSNCVTRKASLDLHETLLFRQRRRKLLLNSEQSRGWSDFTTWPDWLFLWFNIYFQQRTLHCKQDNLTVVPKKQ